VFASLIVGIVVLALGWHMQSLSVHQDMATTVYTTARGERANIRLPDGSTVALNVESRLVVPSDYARGHRTLQLTGEALFSVMHHPQSEFTVTSGGITTRVLGTSFVVRHYQNDTSTFVAVRDGKVGVRTAVLSAGQQSDVTTQGAASVQAVDPSRFTFVTGVLTLNDVPMRDAIVELGRWYNLDIRLGDSKLAARRIGGGFAAGASSDMISFFETMLNVRVVRDGQVVTLYPRSST
jgi:ferric-dicitrate binding protein FerR (iron transport regulator)